MTAPTMSHDTSAPVLVTGATGYVAGWIVRRLLEEGYTVHGTVRDPDNAGKVGHLTAMGEELPGTLRLFAADLTKPGSFDAAMEGVRTVFHTASPFSTTVDDPQRDLVEPALDGTRTVLDSATRAGSVRRVVLTSSCAAIYGDNADVAEAPGGILTEDVWNTSSTLDHQPYSYSKTVAERAAWEIAAGQDGWDLVVVNPAFVVGPALSDAPTSDSFNLLRQIADGSFRSGVPHLELGVVDVRDVAEAHLRAAFLPGAEGRHIVYAEVLSLLDMAEALRAELGEGWPLPAREMPRWLVWLVGPMANRSITRRMVGRNMGLAWRADNSKSREALGLDYRPVRPALAEMVVQMTRTGALSAPARAA